MSDEPFASVERLTVVKRKTFAESICVDGLGFVDCQFKTGSRLKYNGGIPPAFQACTFEKGVEVELCGAANWTAVFNQNTNREFGITLAPTIARPTYRDCRHVPPPKS